MSSNVPPPPPPPPGDGGDANPYAGSAPPPPPAPAYGEGLPTYGQSAQSYQGAPEGYGQVPGSYGMMPGDVPAGPPPPPAAAPASILMAVKLMRAGAVVSLLSLVAVFFTGDQIREATQKAADKQGKSLTASQLDAAVSLGIGFAVVFGLLGSGLWLWMASANGKGKSWARIVSTILFGISLISFLFGLSQAEAVISRLLGVILLGVGAGAVYFMYRKESSEFYSARSAKR